MLSNVRFFYVARKSQPQALHDFDTIHREATAAPLKEQGLLRCLEPSAGFLQDSVPACTLTLQQPLQSIPEFFQNSPRSHTGLATFHARVRSRGDRRSQNQPQSTGCLSHCQDNVMSLVLTLISANGRRGRNPQPCSKQLSKYTFLIFLISSVIGQKKKMDV